MNFPEVYYLPNGIPRALGRNTDLTVKNWNVLAARIPIAPRIFNGQAAPKSPNIRRFYHASFLSQRQRGYCTGFNWTGTIMTRLRIPDGATDTTGTPLPKVRLSPLYTYDVGRKACTADGYNMGGGDGLIGSQVSIGTQRDGVTLLESYDSSPSAIDNHRNGTVPSTSVLSLGHQHIVKDFALAQSFQHYMELQSGGHPCSFASSIPSGMMNCDPNTGEFQMTGPIVGGHEYQVLDFDTTLDRIWIAQSWEYWGQKSSDPEYSDMHGYTQLGYCSLTDMERWFSDSAMSSGASEIMFANTVEGWAPPLVDYSSM